MHIEELSRKVSMELLAQSRLGHLACANNGQPYVTPCYFAYHDQYIYGFSTAGQKIAWLRKNPLACLQVEKVSSFQDWTSIIVLGRYEELSKAGESQEARELAYKLLHQHEFWWEPGYTRTVLHGEARPLDPVYYRVSVDEITGHKATPN